MNEPVMLTPPPSSTLRRMLQSALFNFQSLLLVILLFICTCAYMRATAPGLVDRNKQGFLGLFFKGARIGELVLREIALACWNGGSPHSVLTRSSHTGERLSPYVSLACIIMAGYMVF